MKALQKYTNIALFLISATMIVPAYANSTENEQEQVTQEETTIKSPITMNHIVQCAKDNKILFASTALLTPIAVITDKYNLCSLEMGIGLYAALLGNLMLINLILKHSKKK